MYFARECSKLMLRFFKEIYLTAFLIFLRISGWAPPINAAMSVGVITVIEFWFLIGGEGLIETFGGTRSLLQIPKLAAVVAFMGLYAANYYPLVICEYGVTFEREFSHFKKSKKVLLLTTSMVLMLAAIGFFLYSAFIHRRFIGVNKP
jgi:hypothetical protein